MYYLQLDRAVTFSPPSQTRPGVGGVATISALSFLELSSRRNRIHLPSFGSSVRGGSGWAFTLVGAADAGRGAGARRFPLGFMLGLQESYIVLSNMAAARTEVRLGGPPWPASPTFQASFNEQIKHIIRKLHAEFVQPQQQQDESLCGTIEHQMIFARPIDQIPDFDRPVVRS